MPVFACSHCGKKLKRAESAQGARVRCPACGQFTAVPSTSGAASGAGDGPAKTAVSAPPPSELPTLAPPGPAPRPEKTEAASDPGSGTAAGEGQPSFPGASRQGVGMHLAPPQGPGELGRLGPYRVLKVLGTGGMGVIYLAEDTRLERQVALKAMLPGLAASDVSRKRFLREARSAAKIEHDHIVTIFQVDEAAVAGVGTVPYLAMPLLKGEPLDDRLQRLRRLSVAEVLRLGREVASGLAAAHERGLIHRDIKPANVWLESRPPDGGPPYRVKILDFGLARAAGGKPELTQEGAIVGTPAYMAPEQAAGGKVDGRADLFSLGCVLYRASTGHAPFKGSDTISTLLALATEQPTPPHEVNPEVPLALSDLVMRLIAKEPGGRPAYAAAVVQEIQCLEAGDTAAAAKVRTASGRRLRALAWAGGAGVLAAAALGVAVFLFRVGKQEGPEPPEPPKPEPVSPVVKGPGPGPRAGKEPGGPPPLSPSALVSSPAALKLPGVTSWTIETRRQRGPLFAVAHSPDSRWLAAAGGDGVIRVWEPGAGRLERVLVGHFGAVNALAWAVAAGRPLLASGGVDRTVRLWDVGAGRCVRRLGGPTGPVWRVFWAGDRVVGLADLTPRRLYAWDLATGKPAPAPINPNHGDYARLNMAPGGGLMATGHTDGSVRLWKDDPARSVATLSEKAKGKVTCLAWSPDGKVLAWGAEDRQVRFWDVAEGKPARAPLALADFPSPPGRLVFAPGGDRLAVTPLGGSGALPLKVLDLKTATVAAFRRPGGQISRLGWAPDGRMLSMAYGSGSLVVWRMSPPKSLFTVGSCVPGAEVSGLAWSPSGQLLAAGEASSIVFWEPADGKCVRAVNRGGWPRQGTFLAWSSHGRLLAANSRQGPRVFEVATGRQVQILKGHTFFSLAVAWSPDDTKLASTAVGEKQKLRIHDVQSGKELGAYPEDGDLNDVTGLAWSPNGRVLASGGGGVKTGKPRAVLAWLVTREPVRSRRFGRHFNPVRVLAWSPEGMTLASGGADATVRLWGVNGKEQAVFKDAAAPIAALRWLPEGRLAALANDRTVYFWDTKDARLLRSVKFGAAAVFSDRFILPASISPDGRTLACFAWGGRIRLWDLDKQRPTGTLVLLKAADPPVYLAVAADGHFRGSEGVEKEIVYVAQTDQGQLTLPPKEFGKRFGWKNDPARVCCAPR
jgi:WD40 repeat protein